MAVEQGPMADIRAEAQRVVTRAHGEGIVTALLGGLAVTLLCPSASRAPLERTYADIDLAVTSGGRRELGELLVELGYEPDRYFNGLNGDRRLYFADSRNDRHIDVFVDVFEMCHSIELRDRLERGYPALTLSPADLLLTKLQVVQLTRKDMQDAAALLQDVPVVPEVSMRRESVEGTREGQHSGRPLQWDSPTGKDASSVDTAHGAEGIDVGCIVGLTRNDWGLQHTIERNLSKLRESAESLRAPGAAYRLEDQVDAVERAMAEAPKGMRWKMRARVGERVPWYTLPEEANTPL